MSALGCPLRTSLATPSPRTRLTSYLQEKRQQGAVPVVAVKQATPKDRAGINLNRAACFACFIRLRSGIANSPTRIDRPIVGADMRRSTMRLWQPHGWSARRPEPAGVLAEIQVGWISNM